MNDAGEALALLVVDDEPLARLRMRQLVPMCNQPPAQVAGEAADAASAHALLRARAFDAVLLDIALPGDSGLALARALRHEGHRAAVIFVTAHGSHALQAFELEATDYLTKPVRLARLQDALMRVWQRRGATSRPMPLASEAVMPVLQVRQRDRVLRLPHAEIVSLRADQKTVLVRTATHGYVVDESLNELEQRLGAAFVRVHRNALVAKSAIRALELRPDDDEGGDGWSVLLAPGGEWVAVSRRQLPAVKAALDTGPSGAGG